MADPSFKRGDIERVLTAAHELEKMARELEDIAGKLRADPQNREAAYRLAYDWRTDFGKRVVHKLGFGMPMRRKS